MVSWTCRLALAVAGGLALSLGAAVDADAVSITRTFQFTATSFNPATAPVTTVTGSATVTFDPMGGDVFNQKGGITLHSLNVSLGEVVGFNYRPASSDAMTIGGAAPTGVIALGAQDFALGFRAASSGSPTFSFLNYRQTAGGTIYRSTTGSVTVSIAEPATALLLA